MQMEMEMEMEMAMEMEMEMETETGMETEMAVAVVEVPATVPLPTPEEKPASPIKDIIVAPDNLNNNTERKKFGERRPHAQRLKRVLADTTLKHLEQLTKQARSLAGEDEDETEDFSLENIRLRLSGLQKRHVQLREKLSVPEKLAGEKLKVEFEALSNFAGVETCEGDFNDELISANLNQHAADSAPIEHEDGPADGDSNPTLEFDKEKILYQAGGKAVFRLKGGRVGIQFEPSFSGKTYEKYYCIISKRASSQKVLVVKHNIPFFLPLREMERAHLSSSYTVFINHVSNLLQAYVARREQVSCLKEQQRDKVTDLYNSLPYNLIGFALEDANCKVEVNLMYDNLESLLPTRSVVTVWPLSSKLRKSTGRRGSKSGISAVNARRLQSAEELFKLHVLPQGFEDLLKELQALSTAEVP